MTRFARTLIVVAILLLTAGPAWGATTAPAQAQSSWAFVDWFVDWFTGIDDVPKAVSESINVSTDPEDGSPTPEPNQTFALPSEDSIHISSEVSPQNDPNG